MNIFKELDVKSVYGKEIYEKDSADGGKLYKQLMETLFPEENSNIEDYIHLPLTRAKFSRLLEGAVLKYGQLSLQKCDLVLAFAVKKCNISVYVEMLEYMKKKYVLGEIHIINLLRISLIRGGTYVDYISETISGLSEHTFSADMYSILLKYYIFVEDYAKVDSIFRTLLRKILPIPFRYCKQMISAYACKKQARKFINIEHVLNVLMVIKPYSLNCLRKRMKIISENRNHQWKRYKKRLQLIKKPNTVGYISSLILLCRETNDLLTENYMYVYLRSRSVSEPEKRQKT